MGISILSARMYSARLEKGLESGANMGTRPEWKRLGVSVRSSAAAEKNDEGMALKILTRAEDMLDGIES